MKIVLEKSRWHEFKLFFDYKPEYVEFCRVLKDSFGWKRFGYCVEGDEKFWAFSETIFIKLLKERFPELEIPPDVMSFWKKEFGESIIQKEQEKK